MLYTMSDLETSISPATSASFAETIHLLCVAIWVDVLQAHVPNEQVGVVGIKEGAVTVHILHKCDFNESFQALALCAWGQ